MNFETTKALGAVGAILMFIGIFPYVSAYGITILIGAILLLVSLRSFAGYYREAGIFNNALYAVISVIVGAVAFIAVAFVALFDFLETIGINLETANVAELTAQLAGIDFETLGMSVLGRFIGYILLDVVLLFVFIIVMAFLLRKSLSLLAEKSSTSMFGSTGTVLLIGAILVIAFGIGLLIVWVSLLLLAIAFFQAKPPQQQVSPPLPQNQPQ
jgi:uncharacterized membrane protein